MINKPCSFLLLLCFMVASCGPNQAFVPSTQAQIPSFTPSASITSTLTLTAFPSLTPTLTSTPQPPLVEHAWQPEIALVLVYETPGDGGAAIPYSVPPYFSLFADGRLFVVREEPAYSHNYQIFTKQLSRTEICQHLNALDQIGFFDYDPSTYEFVGGGPNVMGGSGNYIEVNAWRSHKHSYYELNGYIENKFDLDLDNPKGFPVIVPALQNAYNFFTYYPIDNLEIYNPAKVVVRIYQGGSPGEYESFAAKWPINRPSLADLFALGGSSWSKNIHRYFILKGATAISIYEALGKSYADVGFYYEEVNDVKNYYYVSIRPLLPYELPEEGISIIPAPDAGKPSFSLRCYPSDGVLSIPIRVSP